jgi:hypothetical protein
MKKIFITLLLSAGFCTAFSQNTQVLVNGDFEASPTTSSWFTHNPSTVYTGSHCRAYSGSHYAFFGDTAEATGLLNAHGDLYQTVTIPSTASSAMLSFDVSINTLEDTSFIEFDTMYVMLRNSSGSLLSYLGYLGNLYGNEGIPGCAEWSRILVPIPSTYFGTPVRVSFEFSSDDTLPTIFRLDSINLIAYPCATSLSQSFYTCGSSAASTYNYISNVTSSCSWTANVVSGNSWLSTSSGGNGNGTISITVAANTSSSQRTGTIWIGSSVLTVTQPGACSYSLSASTYTLANANAGTFNNVVTMSAPSGCSWSASVTSSSPWLSTTSSGSGNGGIGISVQANTTINSRQGTIAAGGQTLTITQPGIPCTYTLSATTFNCPGSTAHTYDAANLTATAGCTWTASVTSGNSWLSTVSTGTGNGKITIDVQNNSTISSRTGTITVGGQTLTIVQPGVPCYYTLSSSSYMCANTSANTYSNIASVTTLTGCTWTATVAATATWLTTSSGGTGNGNISITVQENTASGDRSGVITVGNQTLTVTQPGTHVGVEEVSQANALLLSPNPASTELIVEGHANLAGLRFVIADYLGRNVFNGVLSGRQTIVPVAGLSPGVYFMRLDGDGHAYRFIRN